MKTENKKIELLPIVGAVIIIGLTVLLVNRHLNLKESRAYSQDLATTIQELNTDIENLEYEKTVISEALYSEQAKNTEFERQIEELSDTVGILDKLSKTDPELLQKYSKVFFLNEHYVPENLTKIDEKFLLLPERSELIAREIWPFLEDLLERAEARDLELKVLSGYRSHAQQSTLKANYKVIYGSGANQFSADQGFSEHQLGTTVDFTTPAIGPGLDGFENTPEYEWLTKNAHRYGFTLSYPPNNAYYQYEPWHWRFVGVELAKRLYNDNEYFYDLDQRTIDEFLVNFFDK